jgi:hypothetical protein
METKMEAQKPPMGPPPGEGQEMGGDDGGGAKAVVTSINNGLMKLKEMVSSVPSVSDDTKAKLDSLIQGYQSLIQEIAGGGGGEPAPGPSGPGPQGPPPPRGGMGRATAMGGINGKPAM